MNATSLRGCRVTVMGLGRHGGGVGVARWLAGQGAVVTVTDRAEAASLAASVAALVDVPIARFRLGEHHPDDFVAADLIVINPAVRPGHPLVEAALARGVPVTSEIELFLQNCPATVVGVTGSNGKTTTATMLAGMLRAGGKRTWLGGNIGGSLLGALPAPDAELRASLRGPTQSATDPAASPAATIEANDVVALELSSFQLARLNDHARWPRLAIVTNCAPNHLDWHASWERYVAAKQRLVANVGALGRVVLGPELASSPAWRAIAAERLIASTAELAGSLELKIPGAHNRENALAAAAMAIELGVDARAVLAAAADFEGLDHRLQFVATIAGRAFYNDSKSTSPAAAAAALAAIPGPIWWLAGGDAKGASFDSLAALAARRVRGSALFGKDRQAIADALRKADADASIFVSERMADALHWCWWASAPGDAILLSPAAASLDQFIDYNDRALQFIQLVAAIERSSNDPAARS